MKIDAIVMRELQMPLAHPFETSFGVTTGRRILLVEVQAEGISAWGECVAGEHPYFSDEMIDTAWTLPRPSWLRVSLVSRSQREATFLHFSNRFADIAWRKLPSKTPYGSWSLSFRRSPSQSSSVVRVRSSPAVFLLAFSQHSKSRSQRWRPKSLPGINVSNSSASRAGDVKIFEEVRKCWPEIRLSCDANAAYRLSDVDHIKSWDQFNLLMIEQPLWSDDFYFHARLRSRSRQRYAWMNVFAIAAMPRLHSISTAVGSLISRWVAWVDSQKRLRSTILHESVISPSGVGGCSRPVSAVSRILRFRRYLTSRSLAMSLPQNVIGRKTSSEPEVTVSAKGEIVVPTTPGRGFAEKLALIDKRSVRTGKSTFALHLLDHTNRCKMQVLRLRCAPLRMTHLRIELQAHHTRGRHHLLR